MRNPRAAPAGRDRSESRDTAKIAGSASPRNPSVPIASRSLSVRSFDVACRSSASRQSSAGIPRPSSVTAISWRPGAPHRDLDAGRPRVQAVLDQLLDDRRRALDYLARRDLVDDGVGQPLDRACGLTARSRAAGAARPAPPAPRAASSAPGRAPPARPAPDAARAGRVAAGGRPSAAPPANSASCPASAPAGAAGTGAPCSNSRRRARARVTTSSGNPASRATWMPYDRSVPPGTTRWRKTMPSFHSRTATWTFRTRGSSAASRVSSW